MATFRTANGELKDIPLDMKQAAKLLTPEGLQKALAGRVLTQWDLQERFIEKIGGLQ